jgi:hypothetical protein
VSAGCDNFGHHADLVVPRHPIDIGVGDGTLAGGVSCLNRVHAYRDAAKDDIPALFRQDRSIANIRVLLRLRHRKDHRQNFAHANSPEIIDRRNPNGQRPGGTRPTFDVGCQVLRICILGSSSSEKALWLAIQSA